MLVHDMIAQLSSLHVKSLEACEQACPELNEGLGLHHVARNLAGRAKMKRGISKPTAELTGECSIKSQRMLIRARSAGRRMEGSWNGSKAAHETASTHLCYGQ